MGEESKITGMVAYIDGQPAQIGDPLPEITLPDVSAGVSTEQLTQAMASLSAIWNGITVTINDAAEALLKLWSGVMDAIMYAAEFKGAMKWAEIYNPRLAHFYHHTKKSRTRKKYAKRIMAGYREALHHVED